MGLAPPQPGARCPVCGNRNALERRDPTGVDGTLVCRFCRFMWEQ